MIRERSTSWAGSVLILPILLLLVSGCGAQPQRPDGALTVAELLDEPVYDTQIQVYGQVSLLGELFCPCFVIESGGESLEVWYGLMVEDGGTERPDVSVAGVGNGDWVVVTGELESAGEFRSEGVFWLTTVRIAE